MRGNLVGRRVIITEYTIDELRVVKQKLTWLENDNETLSCLLFQSGEDLWFLWGLVKYLSQFIDLKVDGIEEYQLIDNYNIVIDDKILKGITLYDYQIAAIKKAVCRRNGIIEIPTSGGKTEVIIGILKYLIDAGLIKTAIIIVPTVFLSEQFYLRSVLRGIDPKHISILKGHKSPPSTKILISVINSINLAIENHIKSINKFISNTSLIIFDECHHLRSYTWLRTAMSCENAKYLLAFSGSPFSEDHISNSSGDALVMGITGGVIFSLQHKYLCDQGIIATPLVFFKDIPGKMFDYPGSYNSIYDRYIVENEYRNKSIVKYILKISSVGLPILVLVQRVRHAIDLLNLLNEFQGSSNAIIMTGNSKAFVINEVGIAEEFNIDYQYFLDNFNAGKWNILIATQVFDEGIDIPIIGAVIMAGGGKSKIKFIQRLGRGLRRKKNQPNYVYIIDFFDKDHVYLFYHSKKRKQMFIDLDTEIISDEVAFFGKIAHHSTLIGNENA